MSDRLDLKVGFACNNRCVFCAQGDRRRSVGLVPTDELVSRMRDAHRAGRGLVLTGGEPTIRKDLLRLIAVARELGYAPIQVQTNGRMLGYRRFVRRLMHAGATELSPALHGATAEVHDALTRAHGSFEQTVSGIRNAVALGVDVVTNTVVVRNNLPDLASVVELLHGLGVRRAQLAAVHPVGTAADRYAEVVPDLPAAGSAMRAAVRAGRGLGMEVVLEAVPPCLIRGVEDAVVEDRIPETTVVDLGAAAFDFSTWRRAEGKAKGPPCRECARAAACEGPWREYPERQGWAGYEPYP